MNIEEFDLAELRVEFRQLYKEVGKTGCLQVIYEFLKAAEAMGEVIHEESEKEKGS